MNVELFELSNGLLCFERHELFWAAIGFMAVGSITWSVLVYFFWWSVTWLSDKQEWK